MVDVRRLDIRLAIAAVVVVALGLGLTGVAVGRTFDARLTPNLVLQGRITSALRVPGEVAGERITRRWTVTGAACGRRFCRTLRLVRQRGGGRRSRLTLRRIGPGTYTGQGRFFVGLRCLGRVYRFGLVVPYRITLRITRATTIEGIPFADRVFARYVNPGRLDRTVCPLGPSFDAASYAGGPPATPSPPQVSFTTALAAGTTAAAFADTSRPGGDQARLVSRSWNFGDPASGASNRATTQTATHTFSAPGTYTVTLTVRDRDGLTASQAHTIVIPGPPSANFSAQPTTTPLTIAFTDASNPGPGGAAITTWSWNFGDPASGPTDGSSTQDPQHTFTATGTYTVCLTVGDAQGRTATHCAPVTVSG
jgi:plastocyanin